MKIENLIVGQAYKYKELCEVLEIESKGGNTKIAQFKELERYCKYSKQGHSIIIDSINTKAGEKVDNRKIIKDNDKRKLGNNNDISKNLRYMILDLLSRYESKEGVGIGFSKTLLYRHCGMINHNYRNAKGNKKAWANELNISEIAIEECLDYTDDRLSKTLRRACSTLQNSNKALGYRFGYNYILKGDKNEIDTQETADIELEDIIRDTEYEVMKQMNISRYEKVYQFGRWKEFKTKVMDILRTEYPLEFSNIKYYYNTVVFSYTQAIVKDCKKGFEESFGLDSSIAKANVNQYFSKSLDNTIENRHKKVIDKEIFGKNFNSIDDYRGDVIYIPEQKTAKDSIIKLESNQLSFDIDKTIDNDDENIPF